MFAMTSGRRQPAPWAEDRGSIVFDSSEGPAQLRFDAGGLHWRRRPSDDETSAPWADVLDMTVYLPRSSLVQWRVVDLANWFWPVHGSPRAIQVIIGLRRADVKLDLGRPATYSWRMQLVLDDLLTVLRARGDFSALGRPGVLREVERLYPRVPRIARVFMQADLFGLERQFGGRGTYSQHFARFVRTGD